MKGERIPRPGRGVLLRALIAAILTIALSATAVASTVLLEIDDVVTTFTGEQEGRVPLNIPMGNGRHLPLGLILVFLVLFAAAIANLLTKEVATVGGVAFTAAFLVVFSISERVNLHKHPKTAGHHEHLEQFNVKTTEEATAAANKAICATAKRTDDALRRISRRPITRCRITITAMAPAASSRRHSG